MGEVKLTELEKMRAVQGMSQPIGEFLDWLMNNGYSIGMYDPDDDVVEPVHRSIEQWLAEMFEIDLGLVELERRHVLARIRLQNLERDLVDG